MITTIRRKAAATLVSSGLVAGAFVAQAAPAGAATFTVRPGQSIQAAIDAAPPGSTIVVKPGTYRENLTIEKNNITLQGTPGQTILKPPANPVGRCVQPGPPGGPPSVIGICVIGNGNPDTGTVTSPVTGVSVTGFTVRNFSADGIFVFGGQNTVMQDNTLVNNGEYGVFANTSTGTVILDNRASGSGEAGIYVGDSPNAQAVVKNNTVFGNGFGIFIRSASNGAIVANDAHDNCIGIFFLEAPNSPADWAATRNQVNHNIKACPANDEEGAPPISGGGIVILGGHQIVIQANTVDDNRPSGPTFVSGGIVLIAGSSNNQIVSNTAHGNAPADLIDQSGASNHFSNNNCDTSIPRRLCGRTVTTTPATTTPPPGG
ncbi:MAG: right-handed parallel beta-helix repeat-containing protein [Acidimicrobiales bacterium]